MKAIYISFLFFIFLINKTFSQTNDSIAYYSRLIQSPQNANDLANAYTFFLKKKDAYAKKGFIKNEIYSTQNIADIQKILGYIDESEALNIESLSLIDLLKEDDWATQAKVKTLNDLGKIYRFKKDYKEALKIYNSILKLTTNKTEISIVYNNIGVVYREQGNFVASFKHFEMAYKNALQSNDTLQIARSLDNLGFIQSRLSAKDALKNMQNALNMRIKKKHNSGIYTSYEHLAKHFSFFEDSLNAVLYANKALDLAKSNKSLEQITSALRLKIDLGDVSVAKEYIIFNDSIQNIEEADRNNFNYYVYQYEKKEKALKLSELRSERIQTFTAFLIIISAFLYFILKSKHAREKQKKVFETESRISKKIHDELANDVYSVMVQLENKSATIVEIINDLEDIYQNARDISQEKSVYLTNDSFILDLKRMLGSFNNDQTNVVLKGLSAAMWIDISELKKITVLRVLKELLINMKKHSKASIVTIAFNRDHTNLMITYIDNGIWVCEKKPINGAGLINAENRIKAIRGRFIFDEINRKGLKIDIAVPL